MDERRAVLVVTGELGRGKRELRRYGETVDRFPRTRVVRRERRRDGRGQLWVETFLSPEAFADCLEFDRQAAGCYAA